MVVGPNIPLLMVVLSPRVFFRDLSSKLNNSDGTVSYFGYVTIVTSVTIETMRMITVRSVLK